MARSVWKGPFVHPSLLKKIDKLKDATNKRPIKTVSISQARKPLFKSSISSHKNYKSFLNHRILSKKENP